MLDISAGDWDERRNFHDLLIVYKSYVQVAKNADC